MYLMLKHKREKSSRGFKGQLIKFKELINTNKSNVLHEH